MRMTFWEVLEGAFLGTREGSAGRVGCKRLLCLLLYSSERIAIVLLISCAKSVSSGFHLDFVVIKIDDGVFFSLLDFPAAFAASVAEKKGGAVRVEDEFHFLVAFSVAFPVTDVVLSVFALARGFEGLVAKDFPNAIVVILSGFEFLREEDDRL